MTDSIPADSDSEGAKKPGGLGGDATIPDSEDGLAVGVSGDSHFNPEEDAPEEPSES
ncbi:hypothetical protein [Rathayibacter tanaceti]|uniref:Uncharacterized protein n=2 Tax=Rathayibacter tanaceti TaxID=1671680 RepID=A0ACD2XLZ6_9MICO|nr:hypothetical protein [Rathayibacter tanaceti]KZX21700.1 hypothetical protein ACH61_01188 [Rathayibacter tanaceti]TCO37572.1 hypothetical protein EV639_104241 [Rathayibacter tanaceti]